MKFKDKSFKKKMIADSRITMDAKHQLTLKKINKEEQLGSLTISFKPQNSNKSLSDSFLFQLLITKPIVNNDELYDCLKL